eukprot:UN14677
MVMLRNLTQSSLVTRENIKGGGEGGTQNFKSFCSLFIL